MRPLVYVLATTVPFALACAGPGGGGSTLVRVDYSHVDGGSCLMGGGKPRLAWNQGEWDFSGCSPRGVDDDSRSDVCWAAANAECCTQIGGEIVAWEAFTVGSEKLVAPLCRL